jgi:hypothetical protein
LSWGMKRSSRSAPAGSGLDMGKVVAMGTALGRCPPFLLCSSTARSLCRRDIACQGNAHVFPFKLCVCIKFLSEPKGNQIYMAASAQLTRGTCILPTTTNWSEKILKLQLFWDVWSSR